MIRRKRLEHLFLMLCTFAIGVGASGDGCKKNPQANPAILPPLEASEFGLSSQYQVSPYPVDNFGVFTSYNPPKGSTWDEGNQICATWSCLGVDYKDIPSDPTQRLWLDGFADPGTGGTATLSDDKQNTFGITLLLPALAKLIDIKGNVDWTKGVKVKIQTGPGHKRVLNRIKALNYLQSTLKPGNPLKDAFDRGDLVVIVADFLVDSLDATITVNKDLNVGAEAALSQTASLAKLPVGKDSKGNPASLSGKLENKGNGEYHLEVKNPVVLAVFPKQQPSGGNLGQPPPNAKDEDQWQDWSSVNRKIDWQLHR